MWPVNVPELSPAGFTETAKVAGVASLAGAMPSHDPPESVETVVVRFWASVGSLLETVMVCALGEIPAGSYEKTRVEFDGYSPGEPT